MGNSWQMPDPKEQGTGSYAGWRACRIQEIHMPERLRIERGTVGVKGINAVIFRRYENDVVDAACRPW